MSRFGLFVTACVINIFFWCLVVFFWERALTAPVNSTDALDALVSFCHVAILGILVAGLCFIVLVVDEPMTNAIFPPLRAASVQSGRDALTIFFPGNGADIAQVARYVGPAGTATGVRHRNSARLIHRPWLGCEVDGSDVQPHGVRFAWWSTVNFGWTDIFIPVNIRAFLTEIRGGEMAEHTLSAYNFGQAADVAQGLRVVRAAMAADPCAPLVLFGTSRGAAVALQVAVQLTANEAQRVRLLVLEGIFTSVPEVLTYRFGAVLGALLGTVLSWVTEYKPAAATPLEAAQKFPHPGLSVALVTSKADRVCDPAMTRRVATALAHAGMRRVATLVLESSPHSDYATDNVADRDAYVAFLDPLYS